MMNISRNHRSVFEHIGFLVNLSQLIEYNLANILALNEIIDEFVKKEPTYIIEYKFLLKKTEDWYDTISKRELGYAVKIVKKKKLFTKPFLNELNSFKAERNFFIHQIFKEDLFNKEFQNSPKKFIPRLKDAIGNGYAINNELINIFKELKKTVKEIDEAFD